MTLSRPQKFLFTAAAAAGLAAGGVGIASAATSTPTAPAPASTTAESPSYTGSVTVPDLLRRADVLMYEAKASRVEARTR